MNDLRLTYLLHAYYLKTATPNEREELMQLLGAAENDEKVKVLLAEIWEQFDITEKVFSVDEVEDMLSGILSAEHANKVIPLAPIKKRSNMWLHIAAASAILFIAVTGVFFWWNQKETKQLKGPSEYSLTRSKNTIVPGENKAILTLSDGTAIVLDSTPTGLLAKQANTKIMKLSTATLSYLRDSAKSEEMVYNTLVTPRGGQYQLILPDGTKVWLNTSSSIYFPTRFNGKERKVTITGEAYFEVAKNTAMPFIVTVKDVEVKVLGTHFNIKAYDDEKSINTTLLEGSVKVSNGSTHKMLNPGQESRVNNSWGIRVVDADVEKAVAWKNGWFQFNSSEITEIMREISRWYDVEIIYEGDIPTAYFSGMVSRKNDISKVLKIMHSGKLRFKIDGRKIIVSS